MSERRELPSLRSRLRIDTSDIDRATKETKEYQSVLGRKVKPGIDDSSLSNFERRLKSSAKDMEEFGRTATRRLTLPIVAAGAASVKLSLDFDKTFQRMVSLAGVSADEVDGLKESVKALAGETGRGPQELAEGLEVIRSAGLSGAEALQVLEGAAKASAIGLGTTREVADAVTSVLNSYGSDVISAAQATDILAGAVEAAKVEASEMAPQFGRLLPLASTLGVEFTEVGGALAFLTRGSGDASLASTQLSGVLQKLLNPSKQSADILGEVGLSVDQVQRSLRDDGLIPTLALLEQAFGGNQQKMAKFFEDAQGIQGVLALLGSDSGAAASGVIDGVGESAGRVSDAFAAFSETDAAKMQQAVTDLQTAMIELGSSLAPIVTDIAGGVLDIVEAFTALPAPVRNGLLVVAAALGPVSSVIGKVGDNISNLTNVSKKGATALQTLGGAGSGLGAVASGGLAVGLGIAAIALFEFQRQANAAKDAARSLRDEAASTGESLGDTLDRQLAELAAGVENALGGTLGDSADAFQTNIEAAGLSLTELREGLTGTEADYKAFRNEVFKDSGGTAEASGLLGDLDTLRAGYVAAGTQTKELAANQKELGVVTDDVGASVTDQDQAQQDANATRQTAIDLIVAELEAARGLVSANNAAKDAIQAYADNQEEAAGRGERAAEIRADAARQEKDDARAIKQATDARTQAEASLADKIEAVTDAEEAKADALEDVESARDRLNELEAEGLRIAQSLPQAYKDAETALAGLQRTAEGDQISVRDAQRAVQAARDVVTGNDNTDAIEDDEGTTVNERQAAIDDLRRAELALEDARQRAGESEAERQEREQAGLDQSPEVQAAQEAITSNADAQATAQDGVTDALGRVADAEQGILTAHGDVVVAQDAVRDSAIEMAEKIDTARINQQTAAQSLRDLQTEAQKKAGELKTDAEGAVLAFITAAEKANVPIDAILLGLGNLASTALPEVRDAIDEVIGRLSGNVDPSLNNPDRTGGGFGFSYGRAKAPRGKSLEGGLDITDSTFGKSKVDATEAELFAGSAPAASVGDTYVTNYNTVTVPQTFYGDPDRAMVALVRRVSEEVVDQALEEVVGG